MSRCFPFPPPGYEKKPRPEDGDLFKEEKRKEKKHKKEKDRDKKEGKEKRDKDRSDRKHREKKDKKDKHRDKKEKYKDKKDKDKDKERSDISEEAKVAVISGASGGQNVPSGDDFKNESINSQEAKSRDQCHGQHAEKHFRSSLPTVETEESKFVQDLARRNRDEQKGAVGLLAETFPVESKRDEKTNRMYIKDSGNLAKEKEKNNERNVISNKMDGQQVRVEPRIGANAILPSFPEMEKRNFHGLLPPLEENVENRKEEKDKSKERRDDKSREKKKKKEKDEKSHGKDKEKKKEEKGKDTSVHKKSEKDKSKEISKSNFVGLSNTNHQVPIGFKDTIAGLTEGNHRKRKDIETNGFLHENEVRPAKLLRPSPSHQLTSRQSSLNGKRSEIHQADMLSSNRQGGVTNFQVINKEKSPNGTIKFPNKHGVVTDIEMGNRESHQKIDMLSSHKEGAATHNQLLNKEKSPNGTVKSSNKHRVAPDIEMVHMEMHQKADTLSSHKQTVATDIQLINKEQSLNGTSKLSNKHRVGTGIEMGNKERRVNGTIKLPNIHEVATDIEVGNKERWVNGTIKGQPLTLSKPKTLALSKPKASSMSPGADQIAEASKRPPHPDSKYLNQILSVPKMDEWSGFDDQEWLFGGSKSTLVRKPDVCLDEVKDRQVWSEALQIDSADVCALPYVIPY